MVTSILMTVHDREPEVLLATLRSLWRCGLSDAEVVVVDDRSAMDYSWVRAYMKPRFRETKWVATGDYEGWRKDGYGNPAFAFNRGLELCTGDRVVAMSSDVIVTPRLIKFMEKYHDETCLWTPKVLDMDSGNEYCGAGRVFPMPWFLAAPTSACLEVGGWDENYLGGLCFEDNDFVGRVALKLGTLRADWDVYGYHQSHIQPAYDINDPEIVEANQRNRDYTKSKWGGIPFDGEFTPFDVARRPDATGCQKFVFRGNNLEELVAKTNGLKHARV
jgi:glycosyltransferase involved in cell wall biosynthesis